MCNQLLVSASKETLSVDSDVVIHLRRVRSEERITRLSSDGNEDERSARVSLHEHDKSPKSAWVRNT